MALPPVGLEAVIANLGNFLAGTKTITNAYNDINVKAGAVEKATGTLGGAVVGLGSHLLNLGAIAGGAALAGVTALGAGLATFAIVGINKAIDLDAQMATIAATMNTTKEAVGPLKDLILDLALDPNLTVNATQAADAIQLLAQNGVTMTDIMDGAAKSTVALANATGSDFGVAANVASGIMKVFNIDAKDMGIAIDGITGVVNQSKFTIDDYAQAFAQAGSVAAGMGVSLQDFNTVIAATSDSFTSGSDAGTSFKTLLQRLANPTDEVRAVTEKYGISLFDAEGNMRPLSQVAGQLNSVLQGTATITESVGGATKQQAAAAATAAKNIGGLTADISTNQKQLQLYNDQLALEIGYYGEGSPKVRSRQLQIERLTNTIGDQQLKLGDYQQAIALVDGSQEHLVSTTKTLTEAEKAELAAVIGGADAARIVLALSQTTAAEFDTLSGSVNDVGQAFRSAATRVDSVKGAFEIFRGIVEAVQIQVGDKFLPILRDVTVGFTDMATKAGPIVVDFFGKIADWVADLVKLFGERGFAGVLARFGLTGSLKFFRELGGLFSDIIGKTPSLDGIGAIFKDLAKQVFPFLTKGVIFVRDFIATITDLFTTFQAGGLFGSRSGSFGSVGLLAALGISPDIIQTIQTVFNGIISFITSHLAELQGAIIGMGAAIATIGIAGTIISIGVAIAGLVTPVGLIIAAAALLGAAWAGNWGGIQEKTFAVWAVVQPILHQIVDWLQVNIPIAVQATVDFWNNTLLPAFATAGAFIMGTVVPAIIELWTWLHTNIPIAIQTVADFWNNSFLPAIATVSGFITTFIATLINLNTWLGTNIALAITTVSNIWTTVFMPVITGVWTFISTLLIPLFQSVADLMGAVLGVAITALAGLWQNVLLPALTVIWHYYTDNIIAVFNQVAQVSKAVLGVAITVLTNLWKNTLLPAITTVWSFISGTLIPVFTAAGEAVDNKVAPPINVLAEKVLPALAKGLAIVVKWIKEATGFFQGLANAVRNFQLPEVLVRHSPSPFEQTLAGIAENAELAGVAMSGFNQATIDQLLGVQRNLVSVQGTIGAAADDVEHFLKGIGLGGGKTKVTLAILKDTFRANADEILNATDRAAKFDEVLHRTGVNWGRIFAGGSADPFAGKGGGVLSVFINSFDKRKKELEKLQQQIFIQAGKTALTIGNKLNDIVSGSVDILDQRVETLQELVNSELAEVNFEGQIISAVQAQDLLNAALAEQRDIQDDILQLKQNEQKLSFLEKQLSLVETLSNAGLDVQDILGGISLGLDASIPDMIAATNKLVMAMIEQVNQDLQLGSPSKLMFKKGLFAGEGFAEGIMAGIPDVIGAMKRMMLGPSQVNGPVLGGGSNSRVTNNNFNQIVNTGASAQNVIAQFEIARAMA